MFSVVLITQQFREQTGAWLGFSVGGGGGGEGGGGHTMSHPEGTYIDHCRCLVLKMEYETTS